MRINEKRFLSFLNFVCKENGVRPTQASLSAILGVSPVSVSRWASGEQTPGKSALESISGKVGSHWVRYLLFNEGPDEAEAFNDVHVLGEVSVPTYKALDRDGMTDAQKRLIARVQDMIHARSLEIDQLSRLEQMIAADPEMAAGLDDKVFEQFLATLGRKRLDIDAQHQGES